ncbi:MAG: glycoside hydrolase family 16 protein [Gemmatimonadetes bacterium]|nr:glycoside hydrolase family 16 protein [Gemmatimonadota bacterium]
MGAGGLLPLSRICREYRVPVIRTRPILHRFRRTGGPGPAVAVLAAALLLGGCGEDEAVSEDTLVWWDEFDGPADQLPDPAKWTFDVGTGWGNNQLEYDTDRAENVSLDGNGHLAIVAREEMFLGSNYTSGRIKTQDLFAHTRGRFEARIRLPVGQGLWPAFWLLGDNFPEVGWPACGEIDIMEYRGQRPREVSGAVHGPGYSGGASLGGAYTLPSGNFNEGFHVFAIEWSENRIIWYVDDVPYQSVTPDDLPSGSPWVYDHPFFILLNVAVGGNFVGSPDASTTFPQTMLVDYVRVYGGE